MGEHSALAVVGGTSARQREAYAAIIPGPPTTTLLMRWRGYRHESLLLAGETRPRYLSASRVCGGHLRVAPLTDAGLRLRPCYSEPRSSKSAAAPSMSSPAIS
jgi:hypothetical protein